MALLGVRDHLERFAEEALLELQVTRERVVLLRGGGRDEAPAPGEEARYLLVLDELRHVVPRGAELVVNRDRLRLVQAVDELPEPVLAHLATHLRC